MRAFKRNKDINSFFGESISKGIKSKIDFKSHQDEKPELYYEHPNGKLFLGDCIEWMKGIESNTIDLIFADPPYNIKKDVWDNFESHDKYIEWSIKWIKQASRIIKPTGTLYICGFSEIICDLVSPALKYFNSVKWLIWHYKNKANLGKDWGRSHESILHFRKTKNFTFNINDVRIPYSKHTLKYPIHPQAKTSQYGNGKKKEHLWEPNDKGAKPKDVIEIPTTCNGMHEKTSHKTQKPEELVRKLILASSNIGDLVVDPFIGSGTTAVCSEQLNRNWLGCDTNAEYLDWTVERIVLVEKWSINDWLQYDKENLERRNSIR
jgi:site-specific DNA-methyltransferase (adenine-specific)